jgi:flagellar protein FlaG
MSLIANPAAATATAVQVQPVAPPALSSAQSRAVPAVAPVEKAPALEIEPLVDPDQIRANLQAAVEKLNEQVERNGRGLNFAIDEKLNRPIITVRSTSTGEIIRTIPTEVVIRVAHNIEDIKGLLMDHTQ